jgi:hypothetical protein
MSSDVALYEVRLLQVPIAMHAEAQEHSAELLREMYLIAQQRHHEAEESSAVTELPARLVELVEALTGEFSGLTTAQDRQLDDAISQGLGEIDLIYQLPAAASPAAQQLGSMLDEVDDFCRSGKHLLTLATPPELVRYRRWYLGEFVSQLGGGAATPWPQYAADSL